MNKIKPKEIEWGVLISAILLVIIGIIALASATGEENNYEECKKQIIWAIAGLGTMTIIIFIDYRTIAKFSPILYGISIALLIAVLFTKPINGATSWFDLGGFSFQPSEIAKIFIIISLSTLLVNIEERYGSNINKLWKLLLVGLFMAIPIVLIAKQPDYGTAIAFAIAMAFMLFVCGLKSKYIVIAIVACVILVPLLYFFVLPEHAVNRIRVFLNPGLDPRGIGYNVIQSKLAIGSGKFLGMGLFKGNQTQLGYLYPKTTDFIFAVIGEEMGFIIAALVIVLYVFLITKAIHIAKTSKDQLGSLIAVGIAAIFTFHMVENIGMTMGLLPITGIPLPFVSYGGSSLLTNFIAIGLLLNISGRRQKAMFLN